MVRLKFRIELKYEIADHPSDFIFNVHAAETRCQSLVTENFLVSQPVDVSLFTDPAHGNRYARLRANPGSLAVHYDAMVDVTHHIASPDSVEEVPIAQLPAEALAYIYPSRYCQSDRLHQFARAEFGALRPGYWRVRAIQDWVHRHTRFVSGSSNATTSAVDTLIEQVGVCRDFAHLMIALCRALNIPARFATGIDYGSDPAFGPTDFHAYVEAFLGGRWYLFDPSGMALPMGLIRLGTGRDAADVSFATIFGAVKASPPAIGIEGIEDAGKGIKLPSACVDALSTDGERAPRHARSLSDAKPGQMAAIGPLI
jgi:transglutaminase-like putative cysteine protease